MMELRDLVCAIKVEFIKNVYLSCNIACTLNECRRSFWYILLCHLPYVLQAQTREMPSS